MKKSEIDARLEFEIERIKRSENRQLSEEEIQKNIIRKANLKVIYEKITMNKYFKDGVGLSWEWFENLTIGMEISFIKRQLNNMHNWSLTREHSGKELKKPDEILKFISGWLRFEHEKISRYKK